MSDVKENCGVDKADLERGYIDEDAAREKPEGWVDLPDLQTNRGGFLGRSEGLER